MRRCPHAKGVLIGGALGWISVVGAGSFALSAPLPQDATAGRSNRAEYAGTKPEVDSVDGLIGTAHPILVQYVGTNGDWMVICQDRQFRKGNEAIGRHGEVGPGFRPFLVLGAGEGIPIDEFVAGDRAGRFVAIVRDGRLSLVDVRSKKITLLPDADVRDGTSPLADGTVTFDGRGQLMLYPRTRGRLRGLVLRFLGSGQELEVDPGPGSVRRTYLDEEGRWMMADLTVTAGDWPGAITDLAPRGCRAPAASYFVAGGRQAGQLTRRWAAVGSAHLEEVEGLIRPVRGGVVIRAKDDAIVRVHHSGTRKELVPRGCHGKVLYADPGGRRVVVVCGGPNARTGILTLFDEDKPVGELPFMRVPDVDEFLVPTDKMVIRWDGHFIELDGMREVDGSAVAVRQTHLASSDVSMRHGIFAVRSDGAELRTISTTDQGKRRSNVLPIGPLHWVFPKR